MFTKTLLSFTFSLAATIVLAQTPVDFSGTWKVTWITEKNSQQEARLVIQNETGSWQTYAKSRSNNCVGTEVPIELKRINENQARVALKFSSVINGCPDSVLRIVKIDENTISGKRGELELTIKRN